MRRATPPRAPATSRPPDPPPFRYGEYRASPRPGAIPPGPSLVNPQHHHPRLALIQHDPVRAGELSIRGDRNVAHRHGVADIAADHPQYSRPTRIDNDIAMRRKQLCRW